jgi:hypothetical protein
LRDGPPGTRLTKAASPDRRALEAEGGSAAVEVCVKTTWYETASSRGPTFQIVIV